MKQGRERRCGEGWLLAAALGMVLLLSLCIWMNRQPRYEAVGPVSSVSVEALERAGKVNINAAGVEELNHLPGVGETTAARIVEYRKANGPFFRAEDLLNVEGIGERTLEKLRQKVRLE